jgi:hypothetical protein
MDIFILLANMVVVLLTVAGAFEPSYDDPVATILKPH